MMSTMRLIIECMVVDLQEVSSIALISVIFVFDG